MSREPFIYGVTKLEEGFYLLRVEERLIVAEYVSGSWYPTGCDFDPWQYSAEPTLFYVICELDLEAIAKAVESQE